MWTTLGPRPGIGQGLQFAGDAGFTGETWHIVHIWEGVFQNETKRNREAWKVDSPPSERNF